MLYKSENSCVYGEHMKHTTRIFATMIKEICREEGVCIESFLDNRIFKLRKDSMYQYIFDYQFDVVDCGGKYNMLGIDSSVMMEHFSRQDNDSYNIAKEIYREAILKMLLS